MAAAEPEGSDSAEVPPEHHQVVIIGGGVSGLAAASALVKHGITDFRLLEARGRLGGRVIAITIDQLKLQLGAMWIHGVLGNPIYELAVASGLIGSVHSQPKHSLMACREDGSRIPFHILEEVHEAHDAFVDRCVEYFLCKHEPPAGVRSVGEHIRLEVDLYLAALPERDRHVRRLLFEYLLQREACISGSHSMDEVDLQNFGSYCDLPGGNIVLPDGYSSILAPLRRHLPADAVLLGHAVASVSWHQPGRVAVRCENGRRLTADHVVCTVPLGVLQRRPQLWRPPLPADRAAAIDRLGFGTCNKIFLEYERPFLPSGVTELVLAWEPTDPAEPADPADPADPAATVAHHWRRKIYSFTKLSDTLLLAWLVGAEAEHLETLPYDEVGRTCTQVLAKFLGDPCVPTPKRTVCSGWRSQPFSRGSYTFIKTGSSQNDIYTISAPLYAPGDPKPRVLFAGEHCHPSFYSTVHGAYLTGLSAVQQIVAGPAADQPPRPHDDVAELSTWTAGIGIS